MAGAFTALLQPLRRTRPRGHRALRLLLDDPASHAAVVAHLVELSRFAPWLAAYYHDCRTALGAWRQQYRRAPRAVRARMRAAYDPREAAALLNILGRLYDESYADMTQIVAFGADAFVLPGF